MTDTTLVQDDHLLHTYKPSSEVFVSGHGARLVDGEGREFLDFLSGIAVSALGHGHPRLVAALREQAGKVLHVSNLLRHEHTVEVATRLSRLSGMDGVFFCNSGTEANEAALKLARKHQRQAGHPERTAFVALEGGFHGRTAGALSVTSHAAYREPFGPLLEAHFVPAGDAAALEQALTAHRPAALILEPVQGEGGLRPLAHDYLRTARELCDRTGTVLVHDEVQSGCGRTGTFLAADAAGVKPDLATLAKPLAAGLPIGALLASASMRGVFQPGDHGTTFGGGPLALCAARVVLEELEEGGLLENVRARGAELARGLAAIAAGSPLATEARGAGLMQGLVVPDRAGDLARALHEQGLLCCTATPHVLRLLPPFVVTSSDVQAALARISDALAHLD